MRTSQNLRYGDGYNARPTLSQNLIELRLHLARIRRLPGCSMARHSEVLLDAIARGVVTLPEYAERWSVVVNWSTLFDLDYWKAFVCLATIVEDPKHLKLPLAWQRLRQAVEEGNTPALARSTKDALLELNSRQKECDIWFVPVQLGLLHMGKSTSQVRASLQDNEVPLDLLNTLVQIVIHQGRLRTVEDMWLDCAGVVVNSRIGIAPCFSVRAGGNADDLQIDIGFRQPDEGSPICGSGTFFYNW